MDGYARTNATVTSQNVISSKVVKNMLWIRRQPLEVIVTETKKLALSVYQFSIEYVLQDTLGEIVKLHVYIRLLDSFVRKYVTAVNRNVII